jgi:nucleotide-binding universal stress UspA family protein
MVTATRSAVLGSGQRVFARIVVGIDGSEQALEAARQAALLQTPDGQLTLFSVWDTAPMIIGGVGTEVPHYFDAELQRTTGETALRAAVDSVAPYTAAIAKLIRGNPAPELLEEIESDEDTLVAVGSSKTGRLLGIVAGAVATEIVHRARCSVLVARSAGSDFPRCLVVGVDGSVESAAAYSTARYVAERFGAELRAVVAWGGKGVDADGADAIVDGDHENSLDAPAEALTAAARGSDLLVVGSRGLHGLHALGSVSEQVAHTAPCSTLVVREPAWQRATDALAP